MSYRYNNPHEWLDDAVKNGKVSVVELLSFIHSSCDSDSIQDNFQSLMDSDGYFDEAEEETPLKIKPRLDCPACHGEGEVNDWVDYGSTTVSMPSICDCVLEQIPEDDEDREIEIDLSDYRKDG